MGKPPRSRIPFLPLHDHGTNCHTAVIAPNRAEIEERFTAGWLNWAGPPNTLVLDLATEFVSEACQQFVKSMGIQCQVIPPDAYWQMGRIKRHGSVLQNMLENMNLNMMWLTTNKCNKLSHAVPWPRMLVDYAWVFHQIRWFSDVVWEFQVPL